MKSVAKKKAARNARKHTTAAPEPGLREATQENEGRCLELERALRAKVPVVSVGGAIYTLRAGGTPGYLNVKLEVGGREQGLFFPTALCIACFDLISGAGAATATNPPEKHS